MKRAKTQKETDRQLRMQFDSGNAYDEDDDEKADRKRMQLKNNQRFKRAHQERLSNTGTNEGVKLIGSPT